ncbi:MAG: peptidylprolyl isomerase [candidate division WOR-3 bacterium]
MIATDDSATAVEVERALARGEQFESLAARYSVHPSARAGGQVRELTEYEIDEPLRSRVARLRPGETTPVTPFDGGFVIVRLDERVPVDSVPDFGAVRQRVKAELELVRRRAAARGYAERLRQRLVYNPEGLAILRRPVDSISEAEKEVWVAIRDSTQYVKVGRLLHIARRFPPGLDTALATYAIRRAIEEDLMYEEGLRRGLEKLPSVREELIKTRRRLLYELLYRREVAGRVSVDDSAVAEYYAAHRDRYPSGLTPEVASLISGQLRQERQRARLEEFSAGLRARARMTVNDRALKQVRPGK